MTIPDSAVADANWLEPSDLYLTTGVSVERTRPIYQGDVFANVPQLVIPDVPPPPGTVELEVIRGPVMVVPHPCQCYHGDRLRAFLTVAPVMVVPSYADFRSDRTGAKDKFALPDLPYQTDAGEWAAGTCVADLGRLFSVPCGWLLVAERMACLSHMGLGLLAKRILGFQLRYTPNLTTTMAFTAAEWNEAYLMQAWIQKEGSLAGYSRWLRTPAVIAGVGEGEERVRPYDVRVGALDVLIQLISGQPTIECS